MNYEEYIQLGLNGEAPLKLVLQGSVLEEGGEKCGVVSVVFATTDKDKAERKVRELIKADTNNANYYMVYSVPLDTDLTELNHYPSIRISKEDLL
jgi:hypothetical protein